MLTVSLQQVPRAGSPCFAGSSCSAETAWTRTSLGISLPGPGSAHRTKGQEIKRLPRALELNLFHPSFLWNASLWIPKVCFILCLLTTLLISFSVLGRLHGHQVSSVLPSTGTYWADGADGLAVMWGLSRWLRKGERKQLQGKEQAGLVFVPLRSSKCR